MHLAKRRGDARHRPRSQRGITREDRVERLSAEDTAHEAHRRARVAAIEDVRRLAQTVQSNALYVQDRRFTAGIEIRPHPEYFQNSERRQAVFAVEEVLYRRFAFSQRV